MKNFTSEQIQEQFNKLPVEVQTIVESPEVRDKIQALSRRHSLMIDQTGELMDEVGLILLGLERSSTFVENISGRLNITSEKALMIAQDVNHDIFDSIKEYMKESENSNEVQSPVEIPITKNVPSNTTLERVGNFSIVPTVGEGVDGDTGPGTHWKEVTAADRNKILAGVEDPGKLGRSQSEISAEENHAEPIIDYLLQNSVGQRERKDIVPHAHASAMPPSNLPIVEEETPIAPPPRSGPDPYHEPVA